ncbi:MAG: UDP-2,3-diacylglucosamine diphosphatase [Bacteroidales bacterium]|jgi:UDP-2,3-diacylglucosamine hydrolase|nr:UDP-2,3-diacylglucosamine diphosphatase [Bacteroidales bacterium]MDI9593575.1 UDP-2,3-diacylglucosamine diphosphatase [Bacteroidota bacterium]OQC37930.1 MAG: UDP-2,3-diacylglucosamine hydrolase [Bacteroidetes bacterium ADurb.Bin041]MBP7873306.1 UDP-2,3-diacylglucosamine diphosphatase [Bacteroidales bacterium]MCO6469127.1 UDP-2,3-diacylglucosamine diphosphatase [Bacteroidales bacterium]
MIYFASDLHFGIPDRKSSAQREEKFIRWLDLIKNDAVEIFLMGDLFDFWFEYKTVVPKGYVRLLGKLAEITDSGIPIHFFKGNHDMWAFDYLEKEIGMTMYRQPIERVIGGKRFFLAHGDGLGPGDRGYKFLKNVFELKINQFLFRWLHPDIGVWLGLYWSAKSRYANLIKEAERGEEYDFQNARIAVYCRDILSQGRQIDYFVFGHWHVVNMEKIGDNSYYIHLGDWLTNFSYGVFDGNTFELKRFDN